MAQWIAFILPPATALAGMRITRLIFGDQLATRFGFGLRFALGLAVGMLVFSQSVLLCALIGINAAALLAWTAILWGAVEAVLKSPKLMGAFKQLKFQPAHLWLLLLLPVIYSFWVFGRLCTLEGTLEFDANAFWVFKAKVIYLQQGKELYDTFHTPNLSYAHLDYPLMVPCLYVLDYGAVGGVNEFVNKVWPFWMMIALCMAILSLGKVLSRPHPLPLLTVTLLCFLPANLTFIRNEGGAIPMVFQISLTALLLVFALSNSDEVAVAAAGLALAGGAMAKFEGIIFAAIWFVLLTAFCWKRGWLKKRILWKAGIVCVICLIPYGILRITKPMPHPESNWLSKGMASPGVVAHRFPQTLFLGMGSRFFTDDFFHWSPAEGNRIKWDGKWNGLGSLVNKEFSVLPWLTLLLLIISLWKKPKYRLPLAMLILAICGQFTILCFAISCLQRMQDDISMVIGFTTNIGRYCYPFFAAGFLGIVAVWFMDRETLPVTMATKSTKPLDPVSLPKPSRSKKLR